MDYFRTGGGEAITLSETGNLAGLIFNFFYPALVIDRINAQIIDAARKVKFGHFTYEFVGTYQFIGMSSHSAKVSSADSLLDRSKPKTV